MRPARAFVFLRARAPYQGLTFWPAWAYPLPESAPGLTSTFVYVPVCWLLASAPCTRHLHRHHRRRHPRLVHPQSPLTPPFPPGRCDDDGYDDYDRFHCHYGDGGDHGDGGDDDGPRYHYRGFRYPRRSNHPLPPPPYCADPSNWLTTSSQHLVAKTIYYYYNLLFSRFHIFIRTGIEVKEKLIGTEIICRGIMFWNFHIVDK